MADGTLTVSLPSPLADEVRAAADARGISPEDYVRQAVVEDLSASEGENAPAWDEDLRRLAEPGANAPLDEAFDRFRANIARARE